MTSDILGTLELCLDESISVSSFSAHFFLTNFASQVGLDSCLHRESHQQR